MAAETWLTGAEAIETWPCRQRLPSGPKNNAQWDLSAYENAPEVEAEAVEEQLEITEETPEIEQKQAKLRRGHAAQTSCVSASRAKQTMPHNAASPDRRETALPKDGDYQR
jgi:hypothetical protein